MGLTSVGLLSELSDVPGKSRFADHQGSLGQKAKGHGGSEASSLLITPLC